MQKKTYEIYFIKKKIYTIGCQSKSMFIFMNI